jgi:hypothetical protein
MKTRIRVILTLLFASFFMQAQISNKKPDSELKQINNMVSEAKSVAAQVITQDLIVQGSACIGFDCVNGESFGFDTIRLKENNLRIKAQDTSNSASFPTNDWQITFNDSANGGKNKFSIDDVDGGRTPFTIEAGAPNNSLYVDNAGRVGFGTSTPVVEMHSSNGDSPTLRLEQSASSGFTPQTWDIAGNESNFFIRDVTNGAKLPFRIRPNAPSNSIFVNSNGNIGLGTDEPNSKLDLRSNGNLISMQKTTDDASGHMIIRSAAAPVNKALFIRRSLSNEQDGTYFYHINSGGFPLNMALMENGDVGIGTITPTTKFEVKGNSKINGDLEVTGNITRGGSTILVEDGNGKASIMGTEESPFPNLYVSGNSSFADVSFFEKDIYVKGSVMPGSIYGPSDARIKNDINPLSDATSVVMNLYPKTFFYKKEYVEELGLSDALQYGLIAQDVEKSLPNLVKEFETKSGNKFKSVNYNALIPILVQAIKEQELKISDLENKVSNYASLESRLNRMEAQLNSNSKNAKR